jgi:hypothetical protein
MCKIIDADCVIASLFAYGDKEEVTIRDLNLLRKHVETRLIGVFVDVCGDTICMAVDMRPDMFEWQDDRIRRTTGAEDRFFTPDYVESHFNWRIPPEYREEVLSVCRSSGG